jgi:hypothetical protein
VICGIDGVDEIFFVFVFFVFSRLVLIQETAMCKTEWIALPRPRRRISSQPRGVGVGIGLMYTWDGGMSRVKAVRHGSTPTYRSEKTGRKLASWG